MIKLYAHPASTCTRKVLCTLHETNTPFDFTLVDIMKGDQKQPAHLARQPFGKVPAIDDNGFQLYESRAIARYINDTYGGKLVPADARGRAVMDQWASIEGSYFSPPGMNLVFHHVFKRTQSDEVLATSTATLEKTLDITDAHLAKVPYLAGEQFSLADIFFLPYVEYLQLTPAKELMAKRSNFTAWWNRASERPSWRKAAGR